MYQRRCEADERVLLLRGGGFAMHMMHMMHYTPLLLYGYTLSQVSRLIYV